MTLLQKFAILVLWLFLFLLPSQLGKHIFLEFSFINGVRIDYLAPAVYLTDILFAILATLYWKHIWTYSYTRRRILVPVIVLTVLNCIFAQYPLLAMYTAFKLFEIYVVFALFRTVHIPQRIVLSALSMGTGLQLLLAMGQFKAQRAIEGLFYFLGERALSISTPGVAKASLVGEQILRPYGTFSHPNSLGGFYVLLFAWLMRFETKSGVSFAIKVAMLVLCAMLVLISFSKTAIIALLIVLVFSFFNKRAFSKGCTLCMIGRIIIGVAVAAVFLSAKGDVFSLEKRITLFKQSVEILLHNPIFGTHFGHHLFAHAAHPSPYPYVFIQPVHNIFMLFLMQAGVLLGGYVLWHLGRSMYKNWRHLVLPLLVILITGNIDHYWITLQQNMLLMGVVFGMVSRE